MTTKKPESYRKAILSASVLFSITIISMAYVTHSRHPFAWLLNTDALAIDAQSLPTNLPLADSGLNNKLAAVPVDMSIPDRKTYSAGSSNIGTTHDSYASAKSADSDKYEPDTRYSYKPDLPSSANDSYQYNKSDNNASTDTSPFSSAQLAFSSVSSIPNADGARISSGFAETGTIHTSGQTSPKQAINNTPAQPATGNYNPDIPPFASVQGNNLQVASCPDVITPHMHTRYNYNILMQMGCNPTFSYN